MILAPRGSARSVSATRPEAGRLPAAMKRLGVRHVPRETLTSDTSSAMGLRAPKLKQRRRQSAAAREGRPRAEHALLGCETQGGGVRSRLLIRFTYK